MLAIRCGAAANTLPCVRIYPGVRRTIEYLSSVDPALFQPQLPPDVRWIGVRPGTEADSAVGPKDVARRIFQAAIDRDRATLELYCPSPSLIDWALRQHDLEVLYLGEPFKAGQYIGVYVHYKVRSGGRVKQWQMALRNDNPERRWLFDGGI